MLKSIIRTGIRRLGYDILKVPPRRIERPLRVPPPVEARWPLPREGGMSDEAVAGAFRRFPHWHYAYAFEDGPAFGTAHVNPGPNTDDQARPLQRFRHFMPYLLEAAGGTLAGKRILDLGCNSGFWSLQCALLGADVTGVDARPELIAQADLLKDITGVRTATFQVMDFWSISPEALGGKFDIVLNLGLLYHLAEPVAALRLTRALAREHILLDTALHPVEDHLLYLKWEEPFDIRMAAEPGMVAVPTRSGLELIFRHLGLTAAREIPVRTADLPDDYLTGRRAAWLIEA